MIAEPTALAAPPTAFLAFIPRVGLACLAAAVALLAASALAISCPLFSAFFCFFSALSARLAAVPYVARAGPNALRAAARHGGVAGDFQ